MGYYGYAQSIIPEYQTRMITASIYPSDKFSADVLLFTGGEDISSSLYGESNHASRGENPTRDTWELAWYRWAVVNKVPMIGICRGMQLFTALTGGKLIQHVLGHYNDHDAITYAGELIQVNSIHHQMCVPKEGTYELLAYAHSLSSVYTTTPTIKKDFENRFNLEGIGTKEPEALWFPHIQALGVQFHPEMLPKDSKGHMFFKNILHKYIIKDVLCA